MTDWLPEGSENELHFPEDERKNVFRGNSSKCEKIEKEKEKNEREKNKTKILTKSDFVSGNLELGSVREEVSLVVEAQMETEALHVALLPSLLCRHQDLPCPPLSGNKLQIVIVKIITITIR